MSERETKEVKVGDHTLVVHTFITGREARDIEGSMMDKLEMSQSTDKGTEITGFKGSQLKERQDMQIKAVVVSFNEVTETAKVLDAILDLPSKESEEIMNVVKEIADPKEDAGN